LTAKENEVKILVL